jgi:hypothetical protein
VVVVQQGQIASKARSWRGMVVLGAAALALLAAIEIVAAHFGYEGPTGKLLHDFVYGPKHGPVIWAALILATVGLNTKERIRCLAMAAAIDAAFIAGRAVAGTRLTFGNGGLIMLVALGLWAGNRWEGQRRADALKGVLLGLTLVTATKVSDAWLLFTAKTQHKVLDPYVAVADKSLGNPAWVMGRVVEATGSVGHLLLQTVYIELPVAAIIVAIYQLRHGWPSHHIVRTFLAIGVLGPICYVLFPVVGPVFAFGAAGKGYAVSHVWPAVESFRSQPVSVAFDSFTPRNCMPSLHTAWAVTIFIHTRRTNRWLERFGAFWLVATLTATLGFGYHYGVDLIAGAVFALTIEAALRDPERGWGWWRTKVVGGGALALAGLLLSYRFLAVPIADLYLISGPLLMGVLACVALSFHAAFFAPAGAVAPDRRVNPGLTSVVS